MTRELRDDLTPMEATEIVKEGLSLCKTGTESEIGTWMSEAIVSPKGAQFVMASLAAEIATLQWRRLPAGASPREFGWAPSIVETEDGREISEGEQAAVDLVGIALNSAGQMPPFELMAKAQEVAIRGWADADYLGEVLSTLVALIKLVTNQPDAAGSMSTTLLSDDGVTRL